MLLSLTKLTEQTLSEKWITWMIAISLLMRVIRSTGSSDLWIPSASCSLAACEPHVKYNPSGSSSSVSVPGTSLNLRYGDGSSTTGSAYKDTVSGTYPLR